MVSEGCTEKSIRSTVKVNAECCQESIHKKALKKLPESWAVGTHAFNPSPRE